MNRKLFSKIGSIVLVGTIMTACGQTSDKENKEHQPQKTTEKNVDNNNKSEYNNKNIKKSEFKGKYIFISDKRRSAVKIDDKSIRFSDGKKNYRYRIIDKDNRIVLSTGKNSNVYITKSNGDSFLLIGIDKSGKINGKRIKLEKSS